MASSAAKLKNYIAQRSTEVIKITELKKVADAALTDSDLHDNFKCRFRHIDAIRDNFDKLHLAIVNLVSAQDNADFESHNSVVTEFENDFYHIQAVYMKLFENKQAVPALINHHSNVRLPKMELPKFDGDARSWQTFIDMFNSVVHANDTITNVEKFTYLINCLNGAPLALVKCTPLTAQNYMVAYNALIKRYQNPRIIATSHWRAIVNTKKVTNPEDSHSLRQLIDTFNENIAVLENLNFPTKHWDFILFNMMLDRLDSTTATKFELENSSLLPNQYYQTLESFLNKICSAIDTVNSAAPESSKLKTSNKFSLPKQRSSSSFFVNSNKKQNCQMCHQDHLIYNCQQFLSKTPEERYNLIKTNKWCSNCLGSKHSSPNCTSKGFCRLCPSPRRHHTLLHLPSKQESQTASTTSQTNSNSNDSAQNSNISTGSSNERSSQTLTASVPTSNPGTILLSTAIVDVADSRGQYKRVRVLLDSASQSHFITSKCSTKLGLARHKLSLEIRGVGRTTTHASQGVSCTIKPCNKSQPLFNLDFVVLPSICSNIPSQTIDRNDFLDLSKFELADPTFNVSQPIDMLLGADIFAHILKGSSHVVNTDKPVALDTIFGWIIMGKLGVSSSSPVISISTFIDSSLENSVKSLWELEQVPAAPSFTKEDMEAEELYKSSVSRDSSGRFCVALPFKIVQPTFPNSRDIALKRFLSLERRLRNDPNTYSQYSDFMREYLSLNHMELISDITPSPSHYYIPHHCVLKPESTTTKLRVVFDASSRCSNNLSLNDTLLTGPKLQPDICVLLSRFRTHAVCFTADLKHMFLQILMKESHRDFQRILWRFSPDENIKDYRLNSVIFGVSSSPFLAIRTIHEIANQYQSKYPKACEVLKTDIFVDDIVTGSSSVSEALNLQADLIHILGESGFEIRKWASNSPQLLSHLAPELLKFDALHLDLKKDTTFKILGLQWNPTLDSFSYQVEPLDKPCSKRTILSNLARVYDPLGFLTPVTLSIKVILQILWASGVDWDDPLPESIVAQWNQFKDELSQISSIQIPRRILPPNSLSQEIIGFCDSSQKAYCAVVYLRTFSNDTFETRLLIAKSRVAPLKVISIPRLELCAALLLSQLLDFTLKTYGEIFKISSINAYTDSMVVLAWLRSSPHKWTTFVANRITQIQEKVPPSLWRTCLQRKILPILVPEDCPPWNWLPIPYGGRGHLGSHFLATSGPKVQSNLVNYLIYVKNNENLF
ncbi:uncharacterized protein [Leptinotarsa decemlineata]|uniref:uncharacterized protein n=1 Tax=Leptinotarsa decemlineata TaxID=7539 RepID=UPI003D306F97